MKIKDVMTRDFIALLPTDTLEKSILSFRQKKLDGLPVLDSKGVLMGVFTKANLYDALLLGTGLQESIEPFYNLQAARVNKDISVSEIAPVIKHSPIGLGVVVDDADKVEGMFTKADMILAMIRKEELLNARLRAMYNGMHNGIISMNKNGLINLVNKAAERILAVEESELINKYFVENFPGLAIEEVLLKGGVVIGEKYECKGKVTVLNITPIFEGDSVVGGIAIFQDITDLEHIATELETVKRLNQTLETVLEMAYDGIVLVDENGLVTLVNKPFLDFFALNSSEIIGRRLGDFIKNSRLHIVAKTGIAEINDVETINGKSYVVTRLPIVREGRIIGAIGKVVFSQVEEIRELAGKLEAMQNKLFYYKKELIKAKRHSSEMVSFDDIVTINKEMIKLKQEARQAAQGDSTFLITGESGTGKELFAQAIHLASPRKKGPFIMVNCAAIPENLLESEFFGYVSGAFTGAKKEGKPGKFELAEGGTIFLDEIGDMPLALQAKILRVLQNKKVERVGGLTTKKVDIRVVVATNHNLEEKVSSGLFREDLFYRLNVIPLELGPLRDRKEDIIPLSYLFLRKYSAIKNVQEISAQALFVLQNYDFPGNVRELENIIERAVNFADQGIIEEKHLPPKLFAKQDIPVMTKNNLMAVKPDLFEKKVTETEYELILSALRSTGGNKSKAAKLLGKSRSWLYEKLEKAKR